MSLHWNPFQFQIETRYLRDDGAYAVLEVKKGSITEVLRFPKAFLPQNLTLGESFVLKLEDKESAEKSERDTLKYLLSELIR